MKMFVIKREIIKQNERNVIFPISTDLPHYFEELRLWIICVRCGFDFGGQIEIYALVLGFGFDIDCY